MERQHQEEALRNYAKSLQKELEDTYDCHPFALGGIVEEDYIYKQGFALALTLLLTKKYIHTGNRKMIEDFLSRTKAYLGQSMEALGETTITQIMNDYKAIKKKIN